MKLLEHKTEKMMRIYVNLTQQDIEETILKHYGIKPEPTSSTETIKCPRCSASDSREANYCWRCGYPLHQQAALKLELKEKNLEKK
jgi:integrase/recombinase XerD